MTKGFVGFAFLIVVSAHEVLETLEFRGNVKKISKKYEGNGSIYHRNLFEETLRGGR